MSAPAGGVMVCDHCGKKNRLPLSSPGVPRCGNCHEPLAWIVAAGDQTFAEAVENSTIPVVVDLWAPWCGPCKMLTPALEKMAHRFAGRIKLVAVNVDEAPSLTQRFEVRGVPMLLVMDHGRIVARRTGALPEDALRVWIERALDAPVVSSSS
jgi:thioredoxin 2